MFRIEIYKDCELVRSIECDSYEIEYEDGYEVLYVWQYGTQQKAVTAGNFNGCIWSFEVEEYPDFRVNIADMGDDVQNLVYDLWQDDRDDRMRFIDRQDATPEDIARIGRIMDDLGDHFACTSDIWLAVEDFKDCMDSANIDYIFCPYIGFCDFFYEEV